MPGKKVAIYNLHFATMGGGERRSALLAAHFSRYNDVTLFVQTPLSKDLVLNVFGIDLSGVTITALEDKDHVEEILKARPDIFINNSYGSKLPNLAPVGIYMCMFPEAEKVELGSYHVITANSAFTTKWILKRWGRESEIVYSACQPMGPPSEKQNVILNVARFFEDSPGAHFKQQDVLVRAFRRLVDLGEQRWELHLAGYAGSSPEDRAYLERIRSLSEGYPIRIRNNLGFNALRDEYRRASIYWHATGFGFDEESQPSKQEHFGMTIVEAMSAGAVPVVFNGGGPREIVRSGVNGDLWNSPDELIEITQGLIADHARRESMADMAIEDSRHFAADRFLSRMNAIVARLSPVRSPWSWFARKRSVENHRF